MEFEELQYVELVHDITEVLNYVSHEPQHLKKGQCGTIVLIHPPSGSRTETHYEIEFFDSEHNSLGTLVVAPDDIRSSAAS